MKIKIDITEKEVHIYRILPATTYLHVKAVHVLPLEEISAQSN